MNEENARGIGYLIIHVTTARGAIPLEGALVNIRSYNSGRADDGDLLESAVSGRDGNTRLLRLPAPPRSESLTPGSPYPYSSYTAEVRLDGYIDQTYIGLPVFDGITSIQSADLIPLPENGRPEEGQPEREQFFDAPRNDL